MNTGKKVHTEMVVDRISDLPEPIRVRILSFLEIREAVRASVLSSSWRALSTWLPNLDCSSYDFHCLLEDPQPMTTRNGYEADADAADFSTELKVKLGLSQTFYTFLDQALESTAELEMLKLYIPVSVSEFKYRLDRWLHGAVRRWVKELELKFRVKQGPRYSLPDSVLVANSIRKLKLEYCALSVPSLNGIQLPSLRELCLSGVHLDDVALGSVFASCLNLEDLTLSDCHGLTVMNIIGLKLQKVKIELLYEEVQAFKMMAPNVLEFRYYGGFVDNKLSFELEGCEKMKHLDLQNTYLGDEDLVVILENLPLLEVLWLTKCYSLQYAEIFCNHLVNLAINKCLYLIRVKAGLANLKLFTYEGYNPLSLVSNGSAPKLVDANLSLSSCEGYNKWFDGLIKLLAKLCRSENLTLDVGYEEDIIIPETKRTTTRPPLYAVKNLLVTLRLSRLKSSVDIVESLLWLAPCPERITITDTNFSVLTSLKFMYEKPGKGKKKCGCWKSPINCWRHSLEKLWIETRENAEATSKLVEFFEKEKIGGTIECFIKPLKPEYSYVEDSDFDWEF